MGDMGEGALHREDEVTIKQEIKIWGPGTKKLNLRHCIANYRPVLSSERAPCMKNKESNCHSNKCNIWSFAPKWARHQDELADTVGRNVTSTSSIIPRNKTCRKTE
jgi:hypothetical protein